MEKYRRRCFLDLQVDGREVGRVVFELYDDLAPKTCENFLQLCTGTTGIGKRGVPLSYKGSTFHRIIKDFMIQGGDFTDGNGTGGESIYGGMFDDEPFIAKHDKPFLLSMANKGPNTNGSQFFITTRPTPHLNGKHVVFGKVVSGDTVITEIEHLKVDAKSRPIADVIIFNCGELIKKRIAREDDESDDDKQKKKKKRRNSSSSDEGKENGNETVQVSTIKPEDLPPEPANQHKYLMRRSKTPEDRKKEKEKGHRRERSRSRDRRSDKHKDSRRGRSRSTSPWRHRKSGRSDWHARDVQLPRNERIERATGVKTKGRGTLRFNRLDRSRTPPHWRREQKRLKTLDDLHTERDRLGGGDAVVKRMVGSHAEANADVDPEEKQEKLEAVGSPPKLDSDAEGIDLGNSEGESDNDDEGEEAKEQSRALEALQAEETKKEDETHKDVEHTETEKAHDKEKKRDISRSRSRSVTPQKKRSRSNSAPRRRRSRSHSGGRKRSPERRRSREKSRERRSSPKRHESSRDRRRKDSHRSRSRDIYRRRSPSRDRRRRRSRSSS